MSIAGLKELYNLTTTEEEICQMVIDGNSNPEMAEKSSVSLETIKTHVQNILRKTGMPNRASLVRLALTVNLPIDKPFVKKT